MKLTIAVLALFGASYVAGAADERWVAMQKGVVTDIFSDLKWTQHDNLIDVVWQDAKDYCNSLRLAGGRWRLPTLDELATLYTNGHDVATQCGSYKKKDYTCRVSPLFYLTGPFFWSAAPDEVGDDGVVRAWGFFLNDGVRNRHEVSDSVAHRALCVRGSGA